MKNKEDGKVGRFGFQCLFANHLTGGGGVGKEEQDPVPLIFGNPVLVERDAEARPRTEQ